jgi:serine protease Do
VLLFVFTAATSRPALAQQPGDAASGSQLAAAIEQTLVEVIAGTEKSVVAIARVSQQEDMAGDWPQPLDPFARFRQLEGATTPEDPDFIPTAFGTGVVIDQQGLILTQQHLLRAGDTHWVTTADRRVLKATIKAADPRSGLAVLSVEANDLVPMPLGNAEDVRKGQFVVALGNPYAIARDGQASASWGIVANVARKAAPAPADRSAADAQDTLHHFGTLIQTDARLNVGTSGGALVNLRGEMIGLTTSLAAIAGYEQSAGYAVPVDDTFRRVIQTLMEGREVEYGFLGISPQNLPPRDARFGKAGMLVADVVEGTPAAAAGLQAGDVITHVDDQPVFGRDGLMLQVGKQPAGEVVRLRYVRNERVGEVEVELAKNAVSDGMIATQKPPAWRGLRVDYTTALSQYVEHLRLGDVDPQGCVAISDVEEGSPAWQQGLRPRMFISHVNDTRVRRPSDFREAVTGQGGPVRLRLTTAADDQPVRVIPPEA